MNLMNRLFREEEGQGMTEYAIVLAGIVGVVAAALLIFGPKINDFITAINL